MTLDEIVDKACAECEATGAVSSHVARRAAVLALEEAAKEADEVEGGFNKAWAVYLYERKSDIAREFQHKAYGAQYVAAAIRALPSGGEA